MVTDDSVIAASDRVYSLDAASGATVPLGDPGSAALAVAEGKLVVGTGAEPFITGNSLVGIG